MMANQTRKQTTPLEVDQMLQLIFCFCCSLLCGYYSRGTTIRGGLLLEGDYYSRETTIQGGLLFKGTTTRRGLLFEGDYYLRGTTIRGGLLFEGDYYSKAAFIYSESPRTSTMAG